MGVRAINLFEGWGLGNLWRVLSKPGWWRWMSTSQRESDEQKKKLFIFVITESFTDPSLMMFFIYLKTIKPNCILEWRNISVPNKKLPCSQAWQRNWLPLAPYLSLQQERDQVKFPVIQRRWAVLGLHKISSHVMQVPLASLSLLWNAMLKPM